MDIPDNLSAIAGIIERHWTNVHVAARPYLDEMHHLQGTNDHFLDDSVRSIVICFLANAGTWRGKTAKAVKRKLNDLVNK